MADPSSFDKRSGGPKRRPPGLLGMPTCRMCGGLQPNEEKGPFVKYGLNHYAHMACFIASGKSTALLTPKQQRELERWAGRRERKEAE